MFAAKDTLLTRPSGGYTIARSVRIRASATAYLNRTASTPISNTTWTWSGWVKRGALSTNQTLAGGSTGAMFGFHTSDVLRLWSNGGGALASSTAIYRDPSAWCHIVFNSNGTTIRGYFNSIEVLTYTGTITNFNSAGTQYIGNDSFGDYFDGYLTEINFVDGQALTPSSFGETDIITGVWKPKKYTATYGTNGYYLNFSDNSAVTTSSNVGIGKDFSGNGNYWTSNNIIVTAGATNDSLVDVPTLDGIDTGTGGQVRGNYAVWNPLTAQGSSITYSNANLAMNWNSSSWRTSPSTFSLTSGKWYAESEVTQLGSATAMIFGASTVSSLTNGASTNLGDWSGSIGIGKGTASAIFAVQGSYPTAPQTIGSGDYNLVAIDCDNGKAWLGYYDSSVPSTTWYSSAGVATGNPATGANPTMTFTVGTEMVVAQGIYNTSTAYNANFGQRTWIGTCPSGFKALCTQNLPASTISNGANHMAATLYTGTGSALTIANTVGSASFQPDFVWVKGRSGATDHALYDSVRGVQKQIETNNTDAETTQTTGLTAFGSTGFTVGALAQMNTNAATYVGWQWNAGGTGVSNTSGTITSTVSANPSAGFSVVTYTGNGTTGNVGHGLNLEPYMIIVKQRNASRDWPVYHKSLLSTYGIAGTQTIFLNATTGNTLNFDVWNSNNTTNTWFSVGASTLSNELNGTYVAYCFAPVAGYSAFGSYTGNGSTDGPFVFTNFRPRWVMIKRTDTSGFDWILQDTSRSTYNAADSVLNPNSSAAEQNGGGYTTDVLSNGFKLRNSGGQTNTSGGTYIYMAFAENPFKYSLAR